MPIISGPDDHLDDDVFIDLGDVGRSRLYLKCEGLNFGGSVKMKVAAEMTARAEQSGELTPGSTLIESSSGNLGVALSMIAANKGYRFLCVTDSRCNPGTLALMESLGAQVHVVTRPHPVSGLVGARIAYIHERLAASPRYVWTNQYTNPANWTAHYRRTAPAILRRFPALDALVVGVGTAGTLMGCARYLRDSGSPATVVAVDVVGSVSFDQPSQPRLIPGLGMGFRPPLLNRSYVDDVLFIDEPQAVRTCRRLAERGFLFGGSTGTVVTGAVRWLRRHASRSLTAVAIAPDVGERYLHSVYRDAWVRTVYGEDALTEPRPAESPARSFAEPVPVA